MKTHWKPTKKQQEALVRSEFEIGYGGARGGGKTDAGMAWLLYDKDHPKYRGLVIRRNADDLSDWVARARLMYAPTKATFSGNPPIINFPSGGSIKTGHLKDENAFEKYQGHEYARMVIEELTQIAREESYLKLISSCRSTDPALRPQVFTTFNPGNAGHEWVKKRFNIVGRPKENILTQDPISGRQRIFIPARVDDNPHIVNNDPTYISFLESLPPGLKEAWRYGDWDFIKIEGAIYENELHRAREERRFTRVPYESNALVHTAWDLGMDDNMSIGFFQFIGSELRMVDFYQNNNYGLDHYVKVLHDKPYVYGTHFFPHDIAVRELGTGRSRRETLEGLGVTNIEVAKNLSIEEGINAVRMIFSRLWVNEDKCTDFITAITQYRREWDDRLGKYRDKPLHDWTSHSADMLRTLATSYLQLKKEHIPRRSSEFSNRTDDYTGSATRFHY